MVCGCSKDCTKQIVPRRGIDRVHWAGNSSNLGIFTFPVDLGAAKCQIGIRKEELSFEKSKAHTQT